MAAMMGLLMAIGGVVGGIKGAIVMFVVSLVINVFTYWNSASLCLRAYNAQEVTREEAPNLYDLVERLAQNAGLPMPKVYIVESEEPNAFATGRDPEHAVIAVTTGIMEALNYEEIAGVLGHELAHVKHRDILISTIVASFAGAISMLANIAQFSAIFGGGNHDDEDNGGSLISTLVMAIIAPIVAGLLQMAVSRSREYDADREGAIICGNPNYLADALQKIEACVQNGATPPQVSEGTAQATAHMFIINPFKGLGNLMSTHPATQERIARLRQQAIEEGITTV